MRYVRLIILVLPLLLTHDAWSQTQRRTTGRRPHNTAREARERAATNRSARANRRGYTPVYPQSDWKRRLGQAQRWQYDQRYGNRRVYGAAYDDAAYYPDNYYGNPDLYPVPYNTYGGPAVLWDPDSYADIYQNKRYYDDGPNGPGYYRKDRWYNWSIAQRRSDQLEDANREGVDQGMRLFQAGAYDRAAVTWLNASTLDQGDAASRVHAGHALFAVGRYPEAVKLIARGFELAPQLAGAAYDIRSDYGVVEEFDQHLSKLETFVSQNPNDVAGLTLLGYVKSYTVGPSYAYTSLQRAHALAPKDTFVEKLWKTAELIGPAAAPPAPNRSTAPIEVAPQDEPIQRRSAPGRMRDVTPGPYGPAGVTPQKSNPQTAPQGVNEREDQKKPAPRPEKMRLVRADDPHR
ncbi:MAG TPA: hypothetical protein P5081_17535 [Phycisphaerae bacterium]|nr:hypothetical protein [Phycisphaerae bacterium]HRW54675.1 hypothetical protein [Phycisphaerae bacterium]